MVGVTSILIVVGIGLVVIGAVTLALVFALCVGASGGGMTHGEADAIDYLLFLDDASDPRQSRARGHRGGRR